MNKSYECNYLISVLPWQQLVCFMSNYYIFVDPWKISRYTVLHVSWCVCCCWCVFTCSPYLDSVQTGTTALCVAAQNGHLRVVELLIAAKAQVDVQRKVKK